MKIDQDEIRIGQNWRNPAIGRMEWLMIISLAVMLGGLMHDGARLLIANAWANYQLEKMQKELGQLNRQMSDRRLAHENAKLRAQLEAERVRKQNSTECKFWMQQSQQYPSQKATANVSTYCR